MRYIVLPSGIDNLGQDWLTFDQTFKQRQFSKEEFYYLNVSQVGTFTVYDVFDCIFECLSNNLCFSLNIATSKGASGKLLCELLSSDKYRNAEEYKENRSSHHFSIMVTPVALTLFLFFCFLFFVFCFFVFCYLLFCLFVCLLFVVFDFFLFCFVCCYCVQSPGVLPKKLGRGVRPTTQNPYPIYDQHQRFSLPYL